MGSEEVFVVDDDRAIRLLVRKWLELEGYSVREFGDGEELIAAIDQAQPQAICLDVMMPKLDGLETLRRLRERGNRVPVILLSAKDMVQTAVEAMRLGAYDYQLKPVNRERLSVNLKHAIRQFQLENRVRALESAVQEQYAFDNIIGTSQRMKTLFAQMQRLLDTNIPVFIGGESGSGKELVARAIHYNGARKAGPFVGINCAAISETLLESELFGHEKGAFTGAVAMHKGTFEQADGGTLFLDEIGEISPAVQSKLLRVLQEGKLQRLGGTQTLSVDVRVVSATHRDIEEMVAAKRFRDDLYYRLVVYTLKVPPLRERIEDIPELVHHFLGKHSPEVGRTVRGLSAEALDVLGRYDWPGNVRELENVLRRALIASDGETIGLEALPEKLLQYGLPSRVAPPQASSSTPTSEDIEPLDSLERRAIERAVSLCEGNLTLAAKKLGIGRTTLYRKMLAYKLPTESLAES